MGRAASFLIFAIVLGIASLASWVGFDTAAMQRGTAISTISGLHVDYLALPREAARLGYLGQELDVTTSGLAIVRVGNYVAKAGPDTTLESLGVDGSQIASFALDSDDNLLTVSDGYFGRLDDSGQSLHAVPLPYDDARLAHSVRPNSVYLYGGAASDYRLYHFLDNGTFELVLKSEEPIVAVADTTSNVYAATVDRVFSLTPSGPECVFSIPDGTDWGNIVSIAASSGGPLFVSTSSTVYAVKGLVAISIINDSGGALQLRGDRLYVLDQVRQLLYTVEPASSALFDGQVSQ